MFGTFQNTSHTPGTQMGTTGLAPFTRANTGLKAPMANGTSLGQAGVLQELDGIKENWYHNSGIVTLSHSCKTDKGVV